MKSKTKRNLSSKQKRSKVLISRFYHGSNAGSIPDISTSSGWLLSSWLMYPPVWCARSFRIINVFINLLSIVARRTHSARRRGSAVQPHTRTDPWLPGRRDASYLQPICCFYKFNLGIKELIVEPCRYNIFNPAVHHINRYRRGQSPIIPGSSTYL